MVDTNEPGAIARMAAKGLKGALDKIAEKGDDLRKPGFVNDVLNDEGVQESGAKLITASINNSVEDITTHAGDLVRSGKEKLNPENKTSYAMIRENLGAPTDSLFKKIMNNILGRVIDVGTGIAGYIGATFVNKIFAPARPVEGGDVHNVFASFMSRAIGGMSPRTA